MPFTIAIDGPAASGKGTIARALSERFGFAHLDTGLLYRAVGAIGGDPIEAARNLVPADLERDGLRTAEAGQAASKVAAIPEVRAALIDFQRRFALTEPGTVLDGRDIGTVICPGAEVKLYVVADDQTRAQRRAQELGVSEQEMLVQIRERDARDAARDVAPMVMAADAVRLDTSDLTIEQAIAQAVAVVEAARS